MRHKRQGFTLIELLIVVVIVVILSGLLMFAGSEGQSMAMATKIVNGLTDVKMAVLTWYRNNTDKIDSNGKINGTDPGTYFTTDLIKKYLNVKSDFAVGSAEGNYQVILAKTEINKKAGKDKHYPAWYACYHLEDEEDKAAIIDKLYDKAYAHGYLLQGGSENWTRYSNSDDVCMEIIIFNY